MKKIKHHYISETYQKNFADKEGKVWFLKSDNKIYSSNPTNTFKERHYNTVNSSLFIENSLSELESFFSSVVRNKINKNIILNKEEKMILSIYISTLLNRTKNERENLRNFLKELVEWGKKITEKDKDNIEAIPPPKGKTYSLKEIKETLENFNPEFSIGSMSAALENSNIICNMNWRFLLAPDNCVFISSDNSVNLCRPEAENKFGFGAFGSVAGLQHKDVELTFPITPKVILLAGWLNSDDLKYKSIPKKWILQLNRRTMRCAKILFANNKDVLKKILAKSRLAMSG